MKYKDTLALVYRVVAAYPFYSKHLTDEMLEDMVREWHEGLRQIPADGAMEAVTMLITEQKWMPTLAEVIGKILDIQYGTEDAIIRILNRKVARASTVIIFREVTEEQEQGYEELTNFERLIIRSPYEFNLWIQRDHDWKTERVRRAKREIAYGKHQSYLNGTEPKKLNGFNVFKELEERKSNADK